MKNNNLQSYAIALFDIAKDKQEKEMYYQQVLKLNEINNTNSELAKVLSMRSIDKADRRALVGDLFKQLGFNQTFIYWVWSIIDNNDYSSFRFIVKECRKLHHYLFNITRIKVTAASELSNNQLHRIIDFFEKKLNTQIDLKVKVQPSLLGGLKIQVNNKTYNNTIQNKLQNLKQQLLCKKG